MQQEQFSHRDSFRAGFVRAGVLVGVLFATQTVQPLFQAMSKPPSVDPFYATRSLLTTNRISDNFYAVRTAYINIAAAPENLKYNLEPIDRIMFDLKKPEQSLIAFEDLVTEQNLGFRNDQNIHSQLAAVVATIRAIRKELEVARRHHHYTLDQR